MVLNPKMRDPQLVKYIASSPIKNLRSFVRFCKFTVIYTVYLFNKVFHEISNIGNQSGFSESSPPLPQFRQKCVDNNLFHSLMRILSVFGAIALHNKPA